MSAWYERWGGYILSIFLHILLVSCLVGAVTSHAVITPPPSFEITFDFAAPEAEAVQAEQVQAAPQLEMAAATGDPEETIAEEIEAIEEMIVPAEESAEDTPEVEPTPEPKPSEELTPEKLLAQAERERREKLEKAWEQYNSIRPASDRRSELKQAVMADEVKVKGMEHLDEITPGAETGAVRDFQFRGDPELIRQIMDRYEMRYVTQYVKEASSGGYLNRAQSARGTFHVPTEPGVYEVFEIGPAGNAKLRLLETEALRAHGFNPKTDRVVSITFGLVRTEQGWDLGVIDFKGEKTQF